MFVKSIQQNDLQGVLYTADLITIGTRSRHAMIPKKLVKLFEGVDLRKIRFQKISLIPWQENVTIRIIEPISLDFDLELQKSTLEKQEDHYRIVAIHP